MQEPKELRVCSPCWDARNENLFLHECEMSIPAPSTECHCPCYKELKVDIA